MVDDKICSWYLIASSMNNLDGFFKNCQICDGYHICCEEYTPQSIVLNNRKKKALQEEKIMGAPSRILESFLEFFCKANGTSIIGCEWHNTRYCLQSCKFYKEEINKKNPAMH